MKYQKINFIVILLLLVFAAAAPAQSLKKTGTTAASFLKIGVGPRAVGMGGAFVATSDDITSMYWNPAGTASNLTSEAVFTHTNWIADIGFDFAAFDTYIDGVGTIGAFVSVLSMDDMPVRTVESPEGTGEMFTYGGLTIGLNISRRLTDNFSIGFNLKYINEYIWHMGAAGFAIDGGVLYRIPILNEFRLAASISNYGTKMQLDGRDNVYIVEVGGGQSNLIKTHIEMEEWDLPLMFRVGVASDLLKTDSYRMTLGVDAIHPNDHTEYVNSGMELSWQEIVFVRAGYKALFQADTQQGLTLGFGLNYRLFNTALVKVDYAYQDFGILKETHYFSLGLGF